MPEISLSAPLSPLRLLLLGYGHVAQALLPLLASRRGWLSREFGVQLLISGIGSRSQGFYISPNGTSVELLVQEQDAFRAFSSSGIHVENAGAFILTGKAVGASLLIELTTLNPRNGQPALTHVRTALQAGMDVITANKGPVAYAQTELQALAIRHNVQFRFESTVMDGFPLFNLVEFTLPSAGIQSFRALLNSTSSLVLSLIEQGDTLEEAISRAQQLGIAEADPSYDLEGWDAVMKTTILSNTLLQAQITPSMVKREGIQNLTTDAIRAAAQANSPIRLISSAMCKDGIVTAQVQPEPIAADDLLHAGKGTSSVISIETELMGTLTLVEHEPTVLQTAYGVFSDLVTVLRQRHTT